MRDLARVFVTGGSGYVGRNLIRHLVTRGVDVRALARSQTARAAVVAAGATAIAGDLDAHDALREACEDVDCVLHVAAKVGEWGPPAEFERINVQGTRNVLEACELASVSRLVHVSTEAVLADSSPIRSADESAPLARRPAGEYARTKGAAERLLLTEASQVQIVIVRPRFVWGGDDTTLIPAFTEAVEDGRFAWISGGRFPTSTCHVDNLVHALWLAASHEDAAGRYFVTDGDIVEFREFLTAMMGTRDVALPGRSVPRWLAQAIAAVSETAWRGLGLNGTPPITRMVTVLLGDEVTVDDSKIRRELGYEPVISRAKGLADLRARFSGESGL